MNRKLCGVLAAAALAGASAGPAAAAVIDFSVSGAIEAGFAGRIPELGLSAGDAFLISFGVDLTDLSPAGGRGLPLLDFTFTFDGRDASILGNGDIATVLFRGNSGQEGVQFQIAPSAENELFENAASARWFLFFDVSIPGLFDEDGLSEDLSNPLLAGIAQTGSIALQGFSPSTSQIRPAYTVATARLRQPDDPVTPVPLPAAGWLLLSGLAGLAAASRTLVGATRRGRPA